MQRFFGTTKYIKIQDEVRECFDKTESAVRELLSKYNIDHLKDMLAEARRMKDTARAFSNRDPKDRKEYNDLTTFIGRINGILENRESYQNQCNH